MWAGKQAGRRRFKQALLTSRHVHGQAQTAKEGNHVAGSVVARGCGRGGGRVNWMRLLTTQTRCK